MQYNHILLNNYTNIFTPAVTGTITTSLWFEKITSTDYLPQINKARELKLVYNSSKTSKNKEAYDKVKKSLPAVSWNGIFELNRDNSNFIKGTGFIYIDVDHADFSINNIDKTKIYAYHKSVGNMGYAIICACPNITALNYESTFLSIINDLDISQYVDMSAKKLTQSSILSHDPNLYINDNAFVYNSVEPFKYKNIPNHFISNKKKEHNEVAGYKNDLQKVIEQNNIVYNNIGSFEFHGNDTIHNWEERFDYVECYKPFHKVSDGRKRTMMNYIRNLVWLNPNIDYYKVMNSSKFVSKEISENPLPDELIEKFVTLILYQNSQGTLTPKITKKIILFNPASKLNTEAKQKLWGATASAQYALKGTERLFQILKNWNFELFGKLSIQSVATNSDMNKKTVAKYWSNFKESITNQNNNNQDEIRFFKEQKVKVINKL